MTYMIILSQNQYMSINKKERICIEFVGKEIALKSNYII